MLRRLILVLASAIFAHVLLGQTPAKSPGNPDKAKKPPGNCSVSGRVVSAAEGAPLRSARVVLVGANQREHPMVYATTTDNDGHFEIKEIEAGRYGFFASDIGYLEQQYKSKGIGDEQGAMLSLTSAQTVDDVIFRLMRAGVITGRVTDDAGKAMIGVSVSVLQKPSEEELEDAVPHRKKLGLTMASGGPTDDRGEYRIFNLNGEF